MRKNLASAATLALVATMFAGKANAQETVMVAGESVSVTDVTNCKNQYYTDRTDNWFLQLGAGIASPFVENKLDNGTAKHHITANYNIGVGKWFSPDVGFRFSGYYGAMHWDNDSYSKAQMANLNFDFMWDMFNSLGGVNPNRVFSIIPFVGIGGAYVWDIQSEGTNIAQTDNTLRTRQWTLPVSAGIQLRFRLCKYADFFLEGRAGFYGDNFNGAAWNEPVDILLTATGGVNINFGGRDYHTYNACENLAYISSLNNQVNALRAELATTAAALAVAQSQLPCPEVVQVEATEVVQPAPMMSTVRFTINSAKISDEEMVNVYNTAQYLKDNPAVSVVIKGYADKDTGTTAYNQDLSQRRAQAVYDALTNTYGISADRLSIEAEGSTTQPYATNNWNRIVIFVPGN